MSAYVGSSKNIKDLKYLLSRATPRPPPSKGESGPPITGYLWRDKRTALSSSLSRGHTPSATATRPAAPQQRPYNLRAGGYTPPTTTLLRAHSPPPSPPHALPRAPLSLLDEARPPHPSLAKPCLISGGSSPKERRCSSEGIIKRFQVCFTVCLG